MVAHFVDLLRTDGIILLDGAMGTELSGRGVIAGGFFGEMRGNAQKLTWGCLLYASLETEETAFG